MNMKLFFFLTLILIDVYAHVIFQDMALIKPKYRVATADLVQFCYTSEQNIGDYLPTLGMWQMLGQKTDIWNLKGKAIDWHFVNKHYKGVIIGGAGILSKRSQHFYEKLLQECKLPMIIWGVGICLPYGKTVIKEGIDLNIARQLETRCDLVNVRDNLTKQYYQFEKANVAPCPTLAYIAKFAKFKEKDPQMVLFTSHEGLVPPRITRDIMETLRKNYPTVKYTNHLFKYEKSTKEIEKIIKSLYCRSKLIVTTRLHGAIVAYALGIPYIAIPYDQKLISFYETYGNGTLAKTMDELTSKLRSTSWISMKPIQLEPVLAFGQQVVEWLENL